MRGKKRFLKKIKIKRNDHRNYNLHLNGRLWFIRNIPLPFDRKVDSAK